MKVVAISGYKRSGKDTAAEYLVDTQGYTRTAFADVLKDMVATEYDIPRDSMDNPELKEAALLHLPVTPKDKFTLGIAHMLFTEFRTAGGQQAIEPYEDASGTFLGVMGRSVEQLYWTPRALCILKGSINRSVASDYWVSRTISDISKSAAEPSKLMVTGDLANINVEIPEKCFVISDLRYRNEIDQLREAFGKDLITVRVERFDTVNSTDPSEKDLDNTPHDMVLYNKSDIKTFYSKVEVLANEIKSKKS